MMRDFLAYAEFEAFLEQLRPETPFGREAKARFGIQTEAAPLETAWDRTDRVRRVLLCEGRDSLRLDRISHHLKRLPRFPEEARDSYDEVDLFQFKKFLHNTRSLVPLLGPELCETFGLHFRSEAFQRRLDQGRQSAETFQVADAYSEELARVRAELRELDTARKEARRRRLEEIQHRHGLAFEHREFLLVPRERRGELEASADLLNLEPYDGTLVLVRALPSGECLRLEEAHLEALARERAEEALVLAELSAEARQELSTLLAYRDALADFDLSLARARLAEALDLVRPTLTQEGPRIEAGRFLPCEALCQQLGVPYLPLDFSAESPATVIFGSNMGGKTIALKTLAFLQLCAQAGLFVPARHFSTRLYAHFHYIGEGCSREGSQGLSGFGFEVRQLGEAWASLDAPSLLLFDEFARTTNSHEAEALISALLEKLTDCPQVCALFSTHFRGIHRIEGVRYLRMQGLDRGQLELQGGAQQPLEDRIRLLNRHMAFHLVPDEGGRGASDALLVAGLLGLDPALVARAQHHFQLNPEPQKTESREHT